MKQSDLDLLFGIGFRTGFLVVVVGLIILYMELVNITVNPMLNLIGFAAKYRSLPGWLQLVTTGFMLMGAALAISTIRDLVESMVEGLFGKD
jgi:hypothetical protein